MQTPGQAERLTTRTCSDPAAQFAERWAWSPTDARLVIQRHGASGDSLILIDALTGERRDLGRVNGTITSLTWSPDGRLVTYATDPSGSISSVNVDDGVHSLLARSLGYVWGIGDPGIHWSPDGTHILIAAASVDDATPSTFGLYLMDPDGSDLRTISDAGSGFAWSPDGSSIAFASSTKAPGGRRFRIWTMSPEDRVPTLVDDELIALEAHHEVGSPVWSPDGSRIAYRVAALSSDGTDAYFVIDADGTGGARPLDALQYLSWRGGWFHCECYG
jgi:Tol biopolymer transport system component